MVKRQQETKTPAAGANPEVTAYLEALPGERKTALARLRAIILEMVPGVKEIIQYRMPYYEYRGMLCAFAAQKQYMSFYLLNGDVVEKNRGLLKGLSVGKGCIRFKNGGDLSEEAVRALLREAVAANVICENDHC
jgi:hypothetical protein